MRRAALLLAGVLVPAALAAQPIEIGQAQKFYVGAGIGYTFALSGSGGARNFAGSVGLETRGPFGIRLEGNETISLLFLTANGTYTFRSRDSHVRPYFIAGIGGAYDLSDGDLTVNGGGGFLLRLSSDARLFGEARVYQLIRSDEVRTTILPVTGGLQVVF